MKTAVMEKVSFLISKKKKNNIGTDIEEAIIHSRCHFPQSSSCVSNMKNQGDCREDKIGCSIFLK
jgi:hypothetical protein